MGPFILAWIVGEGIVIYRTWRPPQKAAPRDIWNPGSDPANAGFKFIPPGPGQLLFSSAVFIMLAFLAEVPKARPLAITLAWGFDIAAYMRLFDKMIPDPKRGPWPPSLAPDDVIQPDPQRITGQGRKLKDNSTPPRTGNGGMVTI